MNRILLKTKQKAKKLPLGKSKFLGAPDTYPGFEWPMAIDEDGDEYNMDFLCQINCAEAAPYDKDGLLPKSGILYFFYDVENGEYRGEADILYYDGDLDELKYCRLMDGDKEVKPPKEQAIEFEAVDYEGFAEDGDSHFLLGEPSDGDPTEIYSDSGKPVKGPFQMLLQIDSFETKGFSVNFCDCGTLCYFVRKSDLAKKKFNKAWLAVHSS